MYNRMLFFVNKNKSATCKSYSPGPCASVKGYLFMYVQLNVVLGSIDILYWKKK